MAKSGRDLESANAANERTPLVAKSSTKSKENPVFALHLSQAARIAAVSIVLAIPLISPKGSIYVISDLVDQKMISAVALQYIFYIIQGTTGATLRQSLNCCTGLFMASFAISMLELAYPGGAQGEGDGACWAAMLVGCAYMVAVPMANFPLVTVVFACSRFAIWWMQFTNPNVMIYTSLKTELLAWVMGSCAAVTATLVPYPLLSTNKGPQLCATLARTLQRSWQHFNDFYCSDDKSTLQISQLKADLSSVFDLLSQAETHIQDAWWECAFAPTHRNARVMMQRQLDVVNIAYGRLLDVLHICVQEDFNEDHDALVKRIRQPITAVTDAACKLLELCSEFSCDGDINEDEAKELQALADDLRAKEHEFAVQYHAAKRDTINRVTVSNAEIAACNGPYYGDGSVNGRTKYKNANGAVIYFSDGWKVNKEDNTYAFIYYKASDDSMPSPGDYRSERNGTCRLEADHEAMQAFAEGHDADALVSEKLMDEDGYCFEVTCFCRLVHDDALDLLAHRDGSKPLPSPPAPLQGTIVGVFNSKVSPEQEEFALKTGMAIILAFFVGYLSSGIVLRNYDFSVAYLVALLTKKGGGSALARSMARLQGMIIGFVSASICRVVVYNELDLAGATGEVIMIMAVGVLVFGAMFLYFHASGNNAFVGQLIAVVGTPQLVMRYSESPYDYRASQLATNSIVCVLIIMGVVNSSFGSRVSDRAPVKLREVWEHLGKMLDDALAPDNRPQVKPHGEVRAMIAAVKYLGTEASEEPRYWRMPWRATLFDHSCHACEQINLAVRSIQCVGSKTDSGGEQTELFEGIVKMESFQELVKIVKEQHEQAEKLLVVFTHETKQELPIEDAAKILEAEHHEKWQELKDKFVTEINKPHKLRRFSRTSLTTSVEFGKDGDVIKTLKNDVACQVSRIILNLSEILVQIRELQREIIKQSH